MQASFTATSFRSLFDLDKAFQAFFRRVKAGETPGYPRFKGRDRFDSFGLKEYGNGFKLDGRRLRITGIGRVRVRWHRPIEGRIKTIRIRRQAGEWYACFACEVEEQPLRQLAEKLGSMWECITCWPPVKTRSLIIRIGIGRNNASCG